MKLNYAQYMKKLLFPILVIFSFLLGACTTPTIVPTISPTIVPTAAPTIQNTATAQPLPTIEASPVPTVSLGNETNTLQIYQFKMTTETTGWALGGRPGESAKVLRTGDATKTWVDMKVPLDGGADPASVVLAGFFLDDKTAWVSPYVNALPPIAEQNVWKTTDRGTTWSKSLLATDGLMEAFSISHIYFVDALNGWLMAHVGAGMNHDYIVIYHTTDGGLTWDRVVDPMNNENVVSGDRGIQSCSKNGLIFSDAQNGWLTGSCNGVAAGVLLFQTHDGGKTWSNVNLPDPDKHPGIYQNADVVCASQFPNVFANGVQLEVACKFMNAPLDQPVVLLYQTSDGGINWEKREIPVGNLVYLPDGRLLVQGTTTSIQPETRAKWTELSDVPEGISIQFISKDIGWILSATGEMYMTSDGGLRWGIIYPQLVE
jgi:photosystem II stability/assembly factor-like uncharacterized protein